MKRLLSYFKWTPFAVFLAIAFTVSLRSSAATSGTALVTDAAIYVDLANEERVIARYSDDLAAYDKQVAELGKRARLTNADLEAIERRSKDLESRLTEVQNAAGDIMRKLKAANEWDSLDSEVASKITDSRKRNFFQQSSFRQLLEESAGSLSSRKNEIGVPLEGLRKKLASRFGDSANFQIVNAAYSAPPAAPMMIKSARCMLAGMRFGVSGLIHGSDVTKRAGDGLACYCFDSAEACAAL